MGHYVNPGNGKFKEIVKDDYGDKTGLVSVINGTIGRRNRLSCVSRPRRFGKSYAAKMLAAYYDCSCDSHALFEGLEISKSVSYEEHINKYHVLYLDITRFMTDVAYMTGILPLKKDGSQSAISEFREYSIIRPKRFAPYMGFSGGRCPQHL